MRSSFEVDSKKTEWDALLLSGSQVRQNAYTQQEESAGGSVTAKWVNKGIVGAVLGLLLVASLVLLVGVEDMNTSKGISVDKKVALSCPSGHGKKAGTLLAAESCIACVQSGVYSRVNGPNRECQVCPAGTTSPGLTDFCQFCANGDGQESPGIHSSHPCSACKAGEYSRVLRTNIIYGPHATPMETRECVACPPGHSSTAKSNSCTRCDAVGHGVNGQFQCVACASEQKVAITAGDGHECVACPTHSHPDASGAHCVCDTGYHHAHGFLPSECVPTACQGNTLFAGQILWHGQYLMSSNKKFTFDMQADGNVVMYQYNADHTARTWTGYRWDNIYRSSVGPGAHGYHLAMQADGNLALYGASYSHIASHTAGKGGVKVVMQDDANIVMYTANGGIPWSSKTSCPQFCAPQDKKFELALNEEATFTDDQDKQDEIGDALI